MCEELGGAGMPPRCQVLEYKARRYVGTGVAGGVAASKLLMVYESKEVMPVMPGQAERSVYITGKYCNCSKASKVKQALVKVIISPNVILKHKLPKLDV